jgi:hypothetical protein
MRIAILAVALTMLVGSAAMAAQTASTPVTLSITDYSFVQWDTTFSMLPVNWAGTEGSSWGQAFWTAGSNHAATVTFSLAAGSTLPGNVALNIIGGDPAVTFALSAGQLKNGSAATIDIKNIPLNTPVATYGATAVLTVAP